MVIPILLLQLRRLDNAALSTHVHPLLFSTVHGRLKRINTDIASNYKKWAVSLARGQEVIARLQLARERTTSQALLCFIAVTQAYEMHLSAKLSPPLKSAQPCACRELAARELLGTVTVTFKRGL